MLRFAAIVAALLAAACTDASQGIVVDVRVMAQAMPTSVGSDVALSGGHVTVVGVSLVPCTSVAGRMWRAVNPLPSAFAHSESSPLTLGVPVVIGLVGERAALSVGHIEPPPGDYCGVTLALGAADADAVGLPDPDMVGRSLRVSGADTDVLFAITSAANDHVHADLAPLTLDASHTAATLAISVDTAVFDHVDLVSPYAADDVLARLHDTMTVNVQ